MSLKTFIATISEKDVVVVQASEELPELIHAAFYREHFEAFLDGQVIWTAEAEAVAVQLMDALVAETSIEY